MPLLFFSLAKGKLLTYILSCYAPLAALLAHHVLRAASLDTRALRANAVINMLFGLIGMLAVMRAAYIFFAVVRESIGLKKNKHFQV